MKKVLFALVFWGFLFASPAWVVAGERQSAGSQTQAIGPYYIELIAKDGQLELRVEDLNRNAVVARGGSAKANVIDKDGNRVTVRFTPVFGNIMRGSGDFKITPDTNISVFLAMDHTGTHVARFSSLVAAAPAQAEGSDEHEHATNEQVHDDNGDGDEHHHDEDASDYESSY